MSDKQAKKERSKAKDLRQTPADDAPSTGKKKRKVAKPWVLEHRYTGIGFFASWREWHKCRRYATKEIAEEAKAALEAKHSWWEFRIVGGKE